ncbi:hypothetical protein CYMTET_41637 [Cymbomonas tetramitiformis]|uniref:Uncharacterized protein n=1 Tax=Cymbomonas tetramitiformis TaxID=36881 RepID=A0AAE0F1T0_9CHLO|nr:hypothetical protein CYMTET_41637 [Cymbomonas tetramitiformis]
MAAIWPSTAAALTAQGATYTLHPGCASLKGQIDAKDAKQPAADPAQRGRQEMLVPTETLLDLIPAPPFRPFRSANSGSGRQASCGSKQRRRPTSKLRQQTAAAADKQAAAANSGGGRQASCGSGRQASCGNKQRRRPTSKLRQQTAATADKQAAAANSGGGRQASCGSKQRRRPTSKLRQQTAAAAEKQAAAYLVEELKQRATRLAKMTAVMERTKPTTAAQAELNADATLKQSTLTTGERTFDTCAAVIEALSRRQPVRAQGSETDAATGTGAEDAERGPKQDEGDGQDSAGRCPRQANHSHRGLGIDGGCGHLHSFGSRGDWEAGLRQEQDAMDIKQARDDAVATLGAERPRRPGASRADLRLTLSLRSRGGRAAGKCPRAACELGFLYKAEMAGTYYEVGNYVAAEPETAMSEETQKEKVAGNIVPVPRCHSEGRWCTSYFCTLVSATRDTRFIQLTDKAVMKLQMAAAALGLHNARKVLSPSQEWLLPLRLFREAVPKSHTIGCVEIFAMWWEWGTPLMGLTAGVKIDNQGVIAQF